MMVRGRAKLQQTVLPLGKRKQPQIFAGVGVFTKRVIAAQHLVARIKCVQRLFAPGTILVMLVHARKQCLAAHLRDAIMQRIRQMNPGFFIHRVRQRLHARLVYGRFPAVDEQLQIAHAQTAQTMHQTFALRCGRHRHAKAAPAHACARASVCQMLAKAHVDEGILWAHHIQREIACVQFAQIEHQINAFSVRRAEAYAVF